jgi:hypothetical protein
MTLRQLEEHGNANRSALEEHGNSMSYGRPESWKLVGMKPGRRWEYI